MSEMGALMVCTGYIAHARMVCYFFLGNLILKIKCHGHARTFTWPRSSSHNTTRPKKNHCVLQEQAHYSSLFFFYRKGVSHSTQI